jgi:serine phosphatase RsbU (regulator of sigma subunit)
LKLVERVPTRLALLHELTSGLAERMDLESIAGFVLGVGLNAIEANRGTLCLLTSDGRSLEVVAHVGYDSVMMDSWQRFPVDAPLPASDAVRSRVPIYLHSPQERADRYPIFANTGGDGASVMLPLIARELALGAIVFGFDGERDFGEEDRSFLAALTTQCAIALDRARLYGAALRRQAELVLLANAASVLAAAGEDLDAALQRFVSLASPALVDICSVHLLDAAPGTSRLVARAFAFTEQLAATDRVSSFGADLRAPHGLGRALRTGEEVVWDEGDDFITQIARSDEHRAALQAMNLGGGIIVPMLAGGRVLGACVFANYRQRIMTDEDRQVARSLGQRAAVLLDNARLLRQRKEVSHGLQAALLPASLPSIPGFELGARYQSAGEGLEVGGDFYDVVPIDSDRWLLVVGDVTGHGVEAAAATGLVRHTIRSAAMMGMPPSEILDHANKAMLNGSGSLPPGVYCTIALARLTSVVEGAANAGTEDSQVVIACAGHPPPMVRRADGRVEQLDAHGRLLGYFPTVEAAELAIELAPGDTLIAFTDGVIERHSDSKWFREPDLMQLLSQSDLEADALAGLIRDSAVHAFPTPPTDDMAILVARRQPV